MYLNLDLLYNVNNYLYPLFYYKYEYISDTFIYGVYSPMTKKSIFKNKLLNLKSYDDLPIYYDYITKKYGNLGSTFNETYHIFTENTLNYYNCIYNKCKPFKLNSEELYFLKSNTRIN